MQTGGYNEGIHRLPLDSVTADCKRKCNDILGTPNDSGMLFCVAFEVLVENLHRDHMLAYRLRNGQHPWDDGNDLAVAVHRRWIFPDDLNYRHELIANYDYWAKELFSNSNLQLELLPHLGLATFVKDPFITKKELARATASFVQVIPEDKI